MKNHLLHRLLSLALAAVLVLGLLPTASAAPALRWEKTDAEVSWDRSDRLTEDASHTESAYAPTDTVRVSIVLEGKPTLRAGFSAMDIGSNAAAMAYDRDLKKVQQTMARTISLQALQGKALDVVWNLTLVSNIISANIPYGSIDDIRAVAGVRDVVIERTYETTAAEAVAPAMYSATDMTGSTVLWSSGMTGAGTRVAIIDTGTDTDHQSFDNAAYLHALELAAQEKGLSLDAYMASLDLLDSQELAGVLKNLNAYERIGIEDASAWYISEKLPFGANYVDYDLTVDHDHDAQGSHGSHVAGIAAANRFLPSADGFTDAMTAVHMCGVAPDAQILTLKVFGGAGGPTDADYFAAIEDAIWLGCDSINLSLGSGSPGNSTNPLFEDLLDFLTTTDTVVVISSGNSGFWAETTAPGHLYNDGVSFQTSGSPGTYTNSLAVASVDNDGSVGKYIQVGDTMIVYTETFGYNSPMASLDQSADKTGTEYEYIFIDGIGVETDYEGIDLTGKIVFCSRGGSSFSETANIAAERGAAAVVIYNNASGTIAMDLSEYYHSAPCVSITRSEAEAVRAASQAHTADSGKSYHTGKVTVSGQMGASRYDSEFYTMSAFSSWGVPGSLELKPEITAPGGMIWSVNGMDPSGSSYEVMSGTSMAAPQVTGMAALAAQYIRENRLEEKTDLSARQLAQSLLMSTAVPLRDGENDGAYYSILNQGAGLARIDLAAAADSYVLVKGMDDGKVKVELGEDPDRQGMYRFSFTLRDLSGEGASYQLSADLFTQDLITDAENITYLDTATRPLAVRAGFYANGQSLEVTDDGFRCDLNGDGLTNAADADHLLEHLVGNGAVLHASGDVNGDGQVNTYDAHVLLTKLSGDFLVEVPANGSVTIDAELELPEEVRAYLDANHPAGAYIEAFVYADSGDTTHSIPVLGYYGSWTEPGMYDVGSYLEYSYASERRAPYLYRANGIRSNYMTINYGDGNEYLFGGNPYVQEDVYLPQRNAFNNLNGATLQTLRYTLIRNAAATRLLVRNADTGEIITFADLGPKDGAYYYINQGAWQNTQHRAGLGLDLANLAQGTRLEISLVCAPELYCTPDLSTGEYIADWDALAGGAYLTTCLTIDNTAPVMAKAELTADGNLRVTARDNEYIAAVALLNPTGSDILASAPANQTEKNVETVTELDLSHVYGSEFLVAVFDYAENEAVYKITLELDNERPRFTALDRSNQNADGTISYVGMDADGTSVPLAPASGRAVASAAEYVEGKVFEITDDDILYVGSDANLYHFTELGPLDPEGRWQISRFNDLAYNRADGKLYGCFYSDINDMSMPYLCTIDMYTGVMNVLGVMPIDANSMAIDDEGNFYSTMYGTSRLYTYRSDVTTTKKATFVGSLSGYATTKVNSLAWDHEEDVLYWCCNSDGTTLLKIDPATAKVTYVNTFDFVAVGLYIAYEPENDIFAPTDKVYSVTLPQTAQTLVNQSLQLSARVLPWNLSDSSLTWTSDDPSVATVDDNGLVRGLSAGTAVITAASVLDPTVTASCTVTVNALGRDLKALIWDEEGQVWWSRFNTDTIPAWEKLAATNLPFNSTMIAEGKLYASTLDVTTGSSDLYLIDPDTFEQTYVGSSGGASYLDMAYAPGMGYGLGVQFNYITLIDLHTGEYLGAWDWTEGVAADLVGITYYGSEYNPDYGANMDHFLILDAQGNVYLETFLHTGGQSGYFYGPRQGYVATIGRPVDYSYFQGFHYDGKIVYWTRFNEADDVVELIAWDCNETGESYSLGYFDEKLWPVGGLYTDEDFTSDMPLATMPHGVLRTGELLATIPEQKNAFGSLHSTADIGSDGTLTIDVTIPAEATNGMLQLTYDTDMLELTGVAGRTAAFAWSANNGTVTLAFAAAEALPEGTAAATLRFRPMGTGRTTVTVTATELNEDPQALTEQLILDVPHICPSESFVDVNPGDWWHEAVDYVVSRGYMNGMDATHYGPGLTMNRAQFVTVLYRMEGQPAVNNTGVFTDVPAGQFFTNAAYWALEKGITTGATPTTFNPGGQLTRTELVTFMYRYARLKGYDTTATADLSGFRDSGLVLSFAVEPWKWAVTHGIVTGMTADTLAPMNLTNRAQAAIIFQRFDSKLADK